MKQSTIQLNDKPIEVNISNRGMRALNKRKHPLLVEMELYFSCLLRLRVNFLDINDDETVEAVSNGLIVRFRPIMTRHCRLGDFDGPEPPTTDFPIVNAEAFTPKWLQIDYRFGRWVGEFGYS